MAERAVPVGQGGAPDQEVEVDRRGHTADAAEARLRDDALVLEQPEVHGHLGPDRPVDLVEDAGLARPADAYRFSFDEKNVRTGYFPVFCGDEKPPDFAAQINTISTIRLLSIFYIEDYVRWRNYVSDIVWIDNEWAQTPYAVDQ